MSTPKEDDLFRHSTMTFGEHLEELRGALFRCMAGLILGFLIALPIAGHVVRWIKLPLQNALKRNAIEVSRQRLADGDNPRLAAENLAIIDQSGLVPTELRLDADALWAQLSSDGQTPNVYRYESSDLLDAASEIAKTLRAAGTSPKLSAKKTLWDAMSDTQQAELARLAEANTSGEQDAELVVDILNGLVQSAEIAEPLVARKDLFADKLQAEAARRLTKSALNQPEAAAIESLNRRLLDRVLADHVGRYSPAFIDIVAWQPAKVEIQSLSMPEPFVIYIKAALAVGLLLASPWVFYQIWTFVAAGLYVHERKYVYVFLPISLGLFLAGAALAFGFVFEPVLNFLLEFNQIMQIDPQPRINDWVGFVLLLPLGFGISFQLPLVMLFMERIGLFSSDDYSRYWKVAVLVVAFLSMVLTPADPMSMLLLAVPLTVLYFGGIALLPLPAAWQAGSGSRVTGGVS